MTRMGWVTAIFIFGASQAFAEETPWAAGAHFVLSLPQSDFANLSKDGEGLGGKVLYRPNLSRHFALRADLAYISYGEKRKSMTDVSYGYYLMQIRNESFQMTLGPQLSLPLGPITAYGAPMGGLYVYRTVVSIPALYYYYGWPAAETTSSLTRWGWNVNGGLLIDVGIGPVFDLQFKYQKIAKAVQSKIEDVTTESDATDFYLGVGVLFYLKKKY
ncbi:outer membrane beta-barrel protein [bacterium]|nr:outer membrane beta-barrel protein [bacterium]